MFLSVPMHHKSYLDLGDTILFNLDMIKSIKVKRNNNPVQYVIIGCDLTNHDIVLNVYDTLDQAVSVCESIKSQLTEHNALISIDGGHPEYKTITKAEEDLPFD